MKYLSIVKGNDYALSLVHYIRHGRKFDCIIYLDEDLYNRYSVTPETAQNYFCYKSFFKDEENYEKIVVIE